VILLSTTLHYEIRMSEFEYMKELLFMTFFAQL